MKANAAPTLPLMHAAFVLAGLGTMLLGPILPILSRTWHLSDAQTGLLPLAQFCGATLGGATVSSRLQRDLLIGLGAAAGGLLLFALAPMLSLAIPGLAIGGFGIGRTIATINITAGARYTSTRGSTLSWLNFSWSLGALLSPLSAAWLATRFPLGRLLSIFAGLFLVCGALLVTELRGARDEASVRAAGREAQGLVRPIFGYFALLILIYGGFETCLSVWLTTFALRYGGSSLVLSEYTMVLLLCGLTAGRAFAAWLLLRMRDSTLQRIALVVSTILSAALAMAHGSAAIASLAVLLGFALAPVFPATFSLLMDRKPSANQAGIALAASGIGAAALPWLMGIISTRTGSLQIALTLPVAAALLLLVLSLRPPSPGRGAATLTLNGPGFPTPPGV